MSPSKTPPKQSLLLEVPPSEPPQAPAPEEAPSSARYTSPRPFRQWAPDQEQLLPARVREVLGEGHLACFFADLVEVLDFGPILKSYTSDRGQPAYHPVMMALLLMYAYSQRITSSREIERRCETDLGFRYLAGGQRPDHDTICAFRVRHMESFRDLFVDTLRVAREAGLKRLGHLSVDGTKMKANASKHKAMSYGRMEEAARKLDEQVEQLLKEAQELDAQEDELYGKDRRGDELPEKMQDEAKRAEELRKAQRRLEERKKEAEKKVALAVEKEKRIEKIREAQQALEEEVRQKAEEEGKDPEQARPEPTAQRNFTDPDSRIMPKSGAFQQSYNAQVAVDAKTQLIVAQEVLQTPSDMRQMEPLVEQAVANTGLVPKELSADAGYFCQEDIEKVEAREVECFTAPGRLKHGEQQPAAPRGRPPARLSRKERRADGAQAADEARAQGLRAAQGDSGARDWPAQERNPAPLLSQRPGQGERGVLPGLRCP